MTEQAEQSGLVPAQAGAPPESPWAAYLAAAQQLDVVRRAASTSAGEQAATIAAARQELTAVRARLAPQRARLMRDFGVPEIDLLPLEGERATAQAATIGGPDAVLAALQQARITADAADHAFIGPIPLGPGRPWARNLLVYGPFAAAVLFVQIILYLVAPSGSLPTYTLLCGLSMPLLAFGLGWATIGFVWGPDAAKGGPPVDRTPVVGIVACLTPVLLTCMGVGLQQLLN
ncbi:hypothetical protein ACWT_7956 [Actinoplanes sp. SE50]|uniref:hypothetical protein n=1 Tax=unclassified Actinoplanes TaxID=2626549 RepID=UPI00023EE03F|nr:MULTISPECIES: hypothetical protein [unclassified Actinoplanes]AEV88965.1 hypothetical protein ACPL_8087 [Actinoplanes sp. SE50/110]ATO87371.1 hypothetical protein ACWT_7956 [Actinoplanes sp. SE50]SLM04789.1 uncharacterized protein ACSP50_8097 [Actinoplanes sp. SE50/110]